MKKRIREKIEAVTGEPEPPSLEGSHLGFQDKARPAEGTPERAALEAAKLAEQRVQLGVLSPTWAQLQQFMKAISEQNAKENREAMIEAIRELKKPDEKTAQKEREADERRAKLIASMVESARAEADLKKRVQRACSHLKPNGIRNLGGQVHGNEVVLICKMCFSELVRRPATADDHQQGPLELLIENQRMGLNA